MLKIRLKRVGRKNDPSFRVVVVDSHQGPKSGKSVEVVGFYNPKTKDRDVKADRVKYWVDHGAQVSDTVHNMLVDMKVIEGVKKNVLPRKSPVTKEKETEVKPKEGKEVSAEGGDKSQEVGVEEKPAEESTKEEAPAEDKKEPEGKEKKESAPEAPKPGEAPNEAPESSEETEKKT